MVAQAITPPARPGSPGRSPCAVTAPTDRRAVIRVCRRYGAVFSLVLTRNTAVQRAIDSIPEDAWTPVKYPGAVRDPDTGAWISDAEVAETDLHHGRIRHLSGRHRPADRAPRQRRQPTRKTACSRSGGITRFSPTPPSRPPTPISPTAATPSSKRPSPTSSTAPWPTSLLDASAPTSAWADLRGDRPQPATRRRDPGRHPPPHRPRGHPAPSPGQHPGPPGPTPTQTDPAPTHPLALGTSMDRPCGTTPSATDPAPKPPTTRPDNQDPDRKSWADQRPTMPTTSPIKINSSTRHHRVDRWNQAKAALERRRDVCQRLNQFAGPATHQRAPRRLVCQDLEGVVRRLPGPEAERARPFELPTPVLRVSPHVDTASEERGPFHEARAEATKPSPLLLRNPDGQPVRRDRLALPGRADFAAHRWVVACGVPYITPHCLTSCPAPLACREDTSHEGRGTTQAVPHQGISSVPPRDARAGRARDGRPGSPQDGLQEDPADDVGSARHRTSSTTWPSR